jgi:hypothetical protein
MKRFGWMKVEGIFQEVTKGKQPGDVISYERILLACAERGVYKDDLPDVQCGIEDAGFIIDYNN